MPAWPRREANAVSLDTVAETMPGGSPRASISCRLAVTWSAAIKAAELPNLNSLLIDVGDDAFDDYLKRQISTPSVGPGMKVEGEVCTADAAVAPWLVRF